MRAADQVYSLGKLKIRGVVSTRRGIRAGDIKPVACTSNGHTHEPGHPHPHVDPDVVRVKKLRRRPMRLPRGPGATTTAHWSPRKHASVGHDKRHLPTSH